VGKYVEARIRAICEWKDGEIEELKVMKDHVHLVVNVPPRVSISELMGILKGKTAIGVFKHYKNLRRKPYWGNHFWSRGYCVTTLGLDEEKIKRYVRYQEESERLEEKEHEEAGLRYNPMLWNGTVKERILRCSLAKMKQRKEYAHEESKE